MLIPAAAMSAPLGGPLAGAVLELRIRTASEGPDRTAADLGASQARDRTALWGAVESALLEARRSVR